MRLIDADNLDIAIYESFVFGRLMEFEKGEKTIDETADLIVDDAEEAIEEQLKDAPTVETQPVRRGEWEWSEYASKWKCSNCWHTVEEEDANTEYEFCPHCGARMDGEL